jgi:phosphodiesterase/alkaline phosphatase D-like protein
MTSYHLPKTKNAPRSIIRWFACFAAALLATAFASAQDNANLSSLAAAGTSLSPAFNPLTGTYTASVANPVANIRITPTTASAGATVTVNGAAVASGTASDPIPLAVGPNLITTIVTAENGTTTRTYTITVNRASAAVVSTTPAVVIDSSRATLNGATNPNGVATVYFEYGPTQEYGSRTPDRDVSGSLNRSFAAGISGLNGATSYHFRAVLVNGAGTIYGENRQFTTVPNPPVAATGAPADVTASTATLIGAVNPNGVKATVYFEYGLTTAYGQTTPIQSVAAGFDTVGVQAPNIPLIAGATYNYRLVASNSAGTAFGSNVRFTVQVGGGGSGATTAAPEVVTGSPLSRGTETAILGGTVNPNSGTTLVRFEYGLTDSYGMSTAPQGVGNGDTPVPVAAALQGLLPGTKYFYRLTASNNLGNTLGEGAEFTTDFPPPTAVTGDSSVLTTTSVNISGEIRARGTPVEAWIDYSTDGITFDSVRAVPDTVTGDASTQVDGELRDLLQGVTYYFRVRATGPNGQSLGETKTLDVESLSGLIQQFPPGVAASERQGSVNVTLAPDGIGAGWRFAGETFWRASGVPATGLTGGDRVIEYRPAPGYTQPATETITVTSGPAPLDLTRNYDVAGGAASGGLTVILKPQDLTEGEAPARWRFYGEGDDAWKESGTTVGGLATGSYVILSKPVAARSTPTPVTAVVADGETTTLSITYRIEDEPIGEAPTMVPFETFSNDTALPNAFVGQIRGDAGSGTGFVVRPRVVATVGHVVFNDGTLAATTGLQWLFQNDRNVHEPVPVIPRGSYLMTGYAAQRALDNSPGVSSPESQNLDVATMFFLQDVGRGGFSGYLASDTSINEFLVSDSLKTLAGYPVDGTPEADLDRLHATPPANVLFSKAFGRTYITQDIRSTGGASGAPVCVLAANGAYYPAAIYLGGTGQTVVRAIDSDVVALIGFADASAGDGVGVNGGQTNTTTEIYDNPDLGALRVIIEPAAARAAGAGWRISNQSPYLSSGSLIEELVPNAYQISFPAVAGFVPPTVQPATVEAATLTTITFTYEQIVVAPVITSGTTASGAHGEGFIYEITADNSPELFTLRGLLPAGLAFDSVSGLISGIPQESGVFRVDIGASNSGGADTRALTITLLPELEDQTLTVPYLQPMSYAIVSSESGGGLLWTASKLPKDLVIDPATGVISGIPQAPGVYQVPVSVTRLGATSQAVLSITVTGIPPQITQQPVAARDIQYGATTTLVAAATGLPEPTLQWYAGAPGDTSNPVEGATSPVFTTPILTQTTSFWLRASSISGTADSNASLITILPSSNANLIGLFTSEGPVSPAFNFGITSYSLTVPNEAAAIQITPLVEVTQSTVLIGGLIVPTDAPSEPVNLSVGSNTIFVDVTSGDGSTTKRYTLAVTRALPPSVTTVEATDVTSSGATLRGSATPNGPAAVFFQYGTSTAYGSATPSQEISGVAPVAVAIPVSGLRPELTYHYRIGITTGAGTIFGSDMTFTTIKSPPLVATGQPIDIEEGVVKLIGAVAPNGTPTTVWFEYGIADESGDPPLTTTPQEVTGGAEVIDIEFTLAELEPGTGYYCRLVGTSAAGEASGEEVYFTVGGAAGLTGTPDATPDVVTLEALDITASSALLQGTANPRGGTTFVYFEYGLTTAYGQTTPARGIGNGSDPALFLQQVDGLVAGETYHFRTVASNSLGTSFGEDLTFTTGLSNPLAVTGSATPLPNGLVRVAGTVRTLGGSVNPFFEYGTDGITFPNRVSATNATVSGDGEIAASADLGNLEQGRVYYYRALAVRADDPLSSGFGQTRTFSGDAIAGLIQKFPRELDAVEYQGSLRVDILPTGIGAWRFVGENYWRESGTTATGLATGDREIEFFPVAGYLQPAREPVGIISGAPGLVYEREYFQSPTPASASLQVFLEPFNRTTVTPTSNRIQWRIARMPDTAWKNSGNAVTGLMAGSYLVEFRAVPGLDAPPPAIVVVDNGQARVADFAYKPNLEVPTNSIRFLSFGEISTTRNLPHAYVGHLKTDAGYHSGFVVKQRVVATTAQAVFDEVTLSQIPGMQWMFQRDREVHEPKPQVPRGFYVFGGYAAQREADNTPGTLSIASQGLNAAAVYFPGDAGRGGFSGFIATDESNQPLLNTSSLKILSGYPVRGGSSSSNFGRMQTTRAGIGAFSAKSATVYGSPDIRGLTGMPGGPLCMQRDGGSYYPIGIYLGGTTAENLYRVIDSDVIDLFSRAEVTANTGENNTSGGISQTSYTAISTTSTKGSLTVILEPAEARDAGALWKLGSDASYVISGTRKNSLTPGDYIVQFRPLPGFQIPADKVVQVLANNLTTVILEYQPELSELASWRDENFGQTSNDGLAADGGDADGDGELNIDEYIAGTDPLDANDVFKVTSSQKQGAAFSAEVQGKAGRIYTLQRSGTLGPDDWINVTSAGPLVADGPVNLSDPEAPPGRAFYRVGVALAAP